MPHPNRAADEAEVAALALALAVDALDADTALEAALAATLEEAAALEAAAALDEDLATVTPRATPGWHTTKKQISRHALPLQLIGFNV